MWDVSDLPYWTLRIWMEYFILIYLYKLVPLFKNLSVCSTDMLRKQNTIAMASNEYLTVDLQAGLDTRMLKSILTYFDMLVVIYSRHAFLICPQMRHLCI